MIIVVLLAYPEYPPHVKENEVRTNRPSNFHTTPGAIVGQCSQRENLCHVQSGSYIARHTKTQSTTSARAVRLQNFSKQQFDLNNFKENQFDFNINNMKGNSFIT